MSCKDCEVQVSEKGRELEWFIQGVNFLLMKANEASDAVRRGGNLTCATYFALLSLSFLV